MKNAIAFVLLMSLISPALAAMLKPTDLRCEYHVDPIGIDVAKPRLSWVLKSDKPDERGQGQSGYQILVASSRQNLDANKGDLWDSDKVDGDATIQIEYAGKPLASNQQAWWKVRVWDANGRSAMSEPATWTMGFMKPSDWRAKWIGYDAPVDDDASSPQEKAMTFDGLKWIWTDEKWDDKGAPSGDRFFVRQITVPSGKKISKVLFILAVDDHANVQINDKDAGEAASFKDATILDVTPLLRAGPNTINIKATNGTGPAGLLGRLMIWTAGDEKPLAFDIDTSWKWATKHEQIAAAGGSAKEVSPLEGGKWPRPAKHHLTLPPPPYLRKTFATDRPIKRALVHASALGIYELHLNGKRVGDDYFTPGWTDYRRRVDYNTYDVTSMLMPGKNAIGAILGDGWYAGYYAWGQRRNLYGQSPRVMVQLDIEYADGSVSHVVTDETWKCAYGPVRQADLIMGCSYDARLEKDGWDASGFDDSSWAKPAVGIDPTPGLIEKEQHGREAHATKGLKITAYPGDPARRHEALRAIAVNEPAPGVYVFDMGQNMVGWARFVIKNLAKGQELTFRYSEMLSPNGMPYTLGLRGARVTDYYIAKGGGDETWEPIFTSHGFRYVEVTGLKEKPSLDFVTGIVVGADIPRTGYFECSDKTVNQLFHNIIWGQKGNYLEVPTDCPQRDERLGWTGDAQFFVPTAAYNFDVAAFFKKWLIDLDTDGQYDSGEFPDVAPDLTGGHGNVAWGDAGIVCPYTIYHCYGDTRIIRDHWEEMTRYIDWLTRTSKDHVRGQGGYGDWLNLGGGAKSEVVGTAYYFYVTQLMSEMATALGMNEAADKYAKLADDIKAAFQKAFVGDDGSIKDSSQTGYALAFTMGLIPSAKKRAAAEKFVSEIEKKNWHLATGFIGTPRLLPALTIAGRDDVAYRLFLTDTYPSWLYQVKLGATTMWERWDGWTPEKGFQDPAMNSFNHYAFGSVGQWMYRSMCGINSSAAGFRKIALSPHPDTRLTFAKAKLDSVRGTIESGWKRDGDGMHYTFVVPVNTTAVVRIPAKGFGNVTESGKPIKEADGVKLLWTEGGVASFEVGSGTYEFVVK